VPYKIDTVHMKHNIIVGEDHVVVLLSSREIGEFLKNYGQFLNLGRLVD